MDLRQLTISGRITADAETRDAGSGRVSSFSVACGYKDKDGDQTDFWRVALWWRDGKEPGLLPYLVRGQGVIVTGDPRVRQYQKKTGGAGIELSINFPRIVLVGGRPSGDNASRGGSRDYANGGVSSGEEIPF
tara:strand:- start:1390 stop:1788 length:399 start_codon:yes stop_codon:yes gene_type:complete